MTYAERIARKLGLEPQRVDAAVRLLDAGNTLPFIARYRKEATGGLDEDQLRRIIELLAALRAVDERREAILASLEEQGVLTDRLRAELGAASTITELEDLYQPFRPKRRTRAGIARERGLERLAAAVLEQPRGGRPPEALAREFITPDVPTVEDALAGARDIVAEVVSDDPAVRRRVREKASKWAVLRSRKIEKAEDPRLVYELYYEFDARVDRIRPHQVLAIHRGEAEKVLRVRVDVDERDWRAAVEGAYRADPRSPFGPQLALAVEDAAKRLLLPAIERDVRRALSEAGEAHAIEVFANNLAGLLNQPPLAGRTVLALDPGFRTGCKVAVIDATGKVLATSTVYPHEPQNRRREALDELDRLVARFGVTLVAIGNGTASRETEAVVAELIARGSGPSPLHYVMVSEAGASVYSASPLARRELPALDVSLRGAVSIGRRVQDPLAELVKIDPKAIGVGMYQHDVDAARLDASLAGVVEVVVNRVGVDLNTASPALLGHVAGIGPKLAERIVSYRDERGPFEERRALLGVPGLGPKTFEQAAGFLRVRGGRNPLDASAIHPESYGAAERLLRLAGTSASAPPREREAALARLLGERSLEELAAEVGVGVPTLEDILEQLARPGRDPREDLPAPVLRSDVLSMEDLRPGMRLTGTVRNVVDFGAFVDIGVKQDGLLHRTQIPREARVRVGDVVEVAVVQIDAARGRISLGWVEEG